MNGKNKALRFLDHHGISTDKLAISSWAEKMCEHMRSGLAGNIISVPMIPTYLSNDGSVPTGASAVVVDAGGTNFRTALVRFTDSGYELLSMKKSKMPGADKPCSWDEFIRFTADAIEPLMDKTDCIGFCFSYEAEITPDMDGLVRFMDKEISVKDASGKLVGASLRSELERRGLHGKKVVVLNDTAAVLLGGAALLDKSHYSGFIGQVSGTGTNTCVSLPCGLIPKLGLNGERNMLINVESGVYNELRGGDIDAVLDRESLMPGFKLFEKLTAGAYLGGLCRLVLNDAADSGLLSAESADRIRDLPAIDGSYVDAWAEGRELETVCDNADDGEFISVVCEKLLTRSAWCMCINLMALGMLTGEGHDKDRPLLVCAEGSLVQKCRVYRQELERLLSDYAGKEHGMFFELHIEEDTTLPGSAAAALLNC